MSTTQMATTYKDFCWWLLEETTLKVLNAIYHARSGNSVIHPKSTDSLRKASRRYIQTNTIMIVSRAFTAAMPARRLPTMALKVRRLPAVARRAYSEGDVAKSREFGCVVPHLRIFLTLGTELFLNLQQEGEGARRYSPDTMRKTWLMILLHGRHVRA